MEKFMIVALDGNKVIDKMKFNKKHFNKNLDNAEMNDRAIIVSKKVADFLEKWT